MARVRYGVFRAGDMQAGNILIHELVHAVDGTLARPFRMHG